MVAGDEEQHVGAGSRHRGRALSELPCLLCGAGAGGEAGMLGSAAERHGQQHMEGLGANFSR